MICLNIMSVIKKYEYFLKLLFVIIGLLLFFKSSDLGWGFIISGIVDKENIYWGMWEKDTQILLLALALLIVPGIAIYFLVSPLAASGYTVATLLYFALRFIIRKWLDNRQTN